MGSLLTETVQRIAPLDVASMEAARRRQDTLTKPLGSLGRLEELSIQVAGISGQMMPRMQHKAIVVMAGDHGVAAQGVSLYPQGVTAQMVLNFLRGGAAINVLARHVGARVVVVDMGVAAELEPHSGLLQRKVAMGTQDMSLGPAMSLDQAIQAIETGIQVVNDEISQGLDMVGTGDMGIANTTPSSAIAAAMTGAPVARVTGRGTGIGDAQWQHKVAVIERVLAVNHPNPADPLDVLAKVGGFEIGGLAGVILGAAAQRRVTIIDGFISGAAALIACGLAPQARDYLVAAHNSAEVGHAAILEHLGLRPLLNLDLRLGEGTGAALAMPLVEAAVKILAEMATFGEAGVSTANHK